MTDDPTLLEEIRAKGVAMKGIYGGRHYGWTTDQEIVRSLVDLGGVKIVDGYNATGPRGWEISIPR